MCSTKDLERCLLVSPRVSARVATETLPPDLATMLTAFFVANVTSNFSEEKFALIGTWQPKLHGCKFEKGFQVSLVGLLGQRAPVF